MNNYQKAILYVSHDRHFLDQTAHAIYELNQKGCKRYPGNYTRFKEQKEIEAKTEEKRYQKYKKKKQELEVSIRRYQQWFDKAHRSAGQNDFLRAKANKNISRFRAKESELEHLESEGIRKPKDDKEVNMKLDSSSFSARSMLHIDKLTFGFNEHIIFDHLQFFVHRQDRIAIIGPNGAGKSTLLKLIMNRLKPIEGSIFVNPNTKIGYFDQELNGLDEDATLLENLLDLPEMTQTEARTILGSFLFRREAVYKKVGDLSMGEKCRAALIRLYFSDANLLILDEPTNYLDIDTRETVEAALQSYPGAMLVVSHDRYFVQKVANRILYLGEKHIIDYQGTYDEFLQHIENRVDANQQTNQNKWNQLNMRMIELMTSEEHTVDDEEYWEEIRSIKKQLAELEDK
nr:ATP-binding cassette domain-containing protein [Salinibacillus kushneri]